ncbi:MAG TPA: hypothetical protein VI669_01450, partial [Vicinamibacteria bacterium]
MEPLSGDRRRLAALATATVLVGAATGAFLSLGAQPVSLAAVLGLSVPLALAGTALLLPIRYVCRTLPLGQASFTRLLATHGLAALLLSSAWVSIGAGLARFLDDEGSRGLVVRYQDHVPGLLA